MKSIQTFHEEVSRRGAITVLAAVFLIVILAFASFTIDFGYIALVDQEMQSAVDSAALAAAQELQLAPDGGQELVVNAAVDLAARNQVDGRKLSLQPDKDVEIGIWNELTGQFTALPGSSLTLANAVRVRGELSDNRNSAMNLFFAPVLGQKKHEMSTEAIAVIGRTRMRDVMLVIDCSGSMSSYDRMTMTRAAALILCDELGEDDRLGLAVYSYPVLVNNGNENDNNTGKGNAGLISSVATPGTVAPVQLARIPMRVDGIAAGISKNPSDSINEDNSGFIQPDGPSFKPSGKGNSGKGNSGKGNSGKGNSGKGNSSKGNSGKGNSGKGNSSKGNSSKGNSSKGNSGGSSSGNGNSGGGGSETRLSGRLEKPLNSNVQPVVARIPQLIPNLYASRTCIGGGMRVAIQEFLNNPRYDDLGNKVEQVMVLMTDGQANETEPPGNDPIDSIYYYAELARQNDIIIHGITLGQNAKSAAIVDAASTTGGEYHHVSDGDFEGLFEVYRGIGRGGNQPRLVH